MIALTSLLGQSAISLDNAEKTGKVKGIAVSGGRVIGVDIGDMQIAATEIPSFEGDVLTYHGGGHENLVCTNPIGQRVLDDAGDLLGQLADLQLAADGSVETVILAGNNDIPGLRLLVIGSYAAIVTEAAGTSSALPPPNPAERR